MSNQNINLENLKEGDKIGDFFLISAKEFKKWRDFKAKSSQGGKNAWAKLTPEERSKRAKKASLAAAKARALKKQQQA